jgi:hypothetical protein
MFSYKLIELDNHLEVWKIHDSYDELYGCYVSIIDAMFDVSQDKEFVGFL